MSRLLGNEGGMGAGSQSLVLAIPPPVLQAPSGGANEELLQLPIVYLLGTMATGDCLLWQPHC